MTLLQLLFLGIPALFALFGLALWVVALIDPALRVARWGAAAFLLAAAGITIGMVRPPGAFWGLLYVHLAVLACYGQALAVRARDRIPRTMLVFLLLTGAAVTIARFAGVSLNLRHLVFNAGIAVALGALGHCQWRWPHRRRSDRLLLGATIFLVLTYLARVGLLLLDPLDAGAAREASFFAVPLNIVFNLIMALGGAVTGLALLLALGWDSVLMHSRRSRTDALTRLGNRFALHEALRENRKGDWPCSGAIAIDLDHFKAVNDAHGHAVGDRLLVAVGEAIRREAGETCRAIRSGGEEFILLTCDFGEAAMAALAERVRLAIAAIRLDGFAEIRPTASVGYCLTAPDTPLEKALRCADSALYEAKKKGRNRVVGHVAGQVAGQVAGSPETPRIA